MLRENDNRPAGLAALVFDFDGTLARLNIDFDRMREEVFALAAGYGQEAAARNGRYVLESIEAAALALRENSPGDHSDFLSQARRIIEAVEMEAAREADVFAEARPALKALAGAGLKLGVITRNFGGAVEVVFPDLADYCPVFLPREAAPRVKPHPDHLLAALEKMEADPSEALMVGDHPIDIETGREAGAMTCGVATGRFSKADLAAAGADLAFDDLAEMTRFLLAVRA